MVLFAFQGMNAYEVLECDVTSSRAEIKQAFHRLSLKYHPDKCWGQVESDNLDKFLQIKTAFNILYDEQTKCKYDLNLKQRLLQLDSNLSDSQTMFSLKQDLEYDAESYEYYKMCRCAGTYSLPRTELNRLLRDLETSESNEISTIVHIQCDSCSLSINVLII
jgi:curved DNA-binding protein CbpA